MENRAPNKSLVKLPHTEKACIASIWWEQEILHIHALIFFLFQLTCTGATIQIRIEDSEVSKRTLHLSVAGKFQVLIDCFYQRGSLTLGTINNGKALAEL